MINGKTNFCNQDRITYAVYNNMNYEHFLERIHFRNNKVCKNTTRQKILSKVQLASYELIFAGKQKKSMLT